MDTITSIGLDIAKTSFAAHCAASSGKEIKITVMWWTAPANGI